MVTLAARYRGKRPARGGPGFRGRHWLTPPWRCRWVIEWFMIIDLFAHVQCNVRVQCACCLFRLSSVARRAGWLSRRGCLSCRGVVVRPSSRRMRRPLVDDACRVVVVLAAVPIGVRRLPISHGHASLACASGQCSRHHHGVWPSDRACCTCCQSSSVTSSGTSGGLPSMSQSSMASASIRVSQSACPDRQCERRRAAHGVLSVVVAVACSAATMGNAGDVALILA